MYLTRASRISEMDLFLGETCCLRIGWSAWKEVGHHALCSWDASTVFLNVAAAYSIVYLEGCGCRQWAVLHLLQKMWFGIIPGDFFVTVC